LRIFLTRHGETELNKQGLLQGRRDSALTHEGVAHAERLGAWLASNYDQMRDLVVWSSPLGRAIKTAEIALNKAGVALPIRTDNRLIEIDGGSLEGLSRSRVVEITGEARVSGVLLLCSKDGESYGAVRRRTSDWIDDRLQEGGDHLVVGHAGSGRVLRAAYIGAGPDRLAEMTAAHSAIFKLEDGVVTEVAVAH
jgi:broad specificity phosphatase PhoE